MITVVNILSALGLANLPFLKQRIKNNKPVVYKINRDTTGARYAINSSGYLEEINSDKVKH